MARPRDERQKDLFRPSARSDHRPRPSDGAAGRRSTGTFSTRFSSVSRRAGTAATALAAGRRAVHPEAHAQPVRRGAVRTLGREPVLPVLLRRSRLPARPALRSLVADALAPAPGRGAARRADPGEPRGGAQDRRHQDPGSRAGRRRHHGAAQGDRASDRRAADAPGARDAGRLRQARRRDLRQSYAAPGQARRHHGRPLQPCPPVQAGAARAQVPAHPARPHHPRHPP